MYRGLYCPHTTKKLSSDTIYAEIASDSTGKGLSPIRLPHFLPLSVRACTLTHTHTLQTPLANPSCYPYFSLTGYKIEIPTTSSLGLISLSEWLTELRKTLYLLNHCLLWFIMKGYGEGNGTPLQYSCLENPMEGGAWWAAVHEVAKSWTRLSDFTFTFHFPALEKAMATHSSVLAWRIPGTGEPGGLPSMGSHRVGHDWSDSSSSSMKGYNSERAR